MRDLQQYRVRNRLLRTLHPDDFDRLRLGLETIPVEFGYTLSRANERIEYVYFPENGLASLTANAAPHRIEVGVIGREGLVGVPVVLGATSGPNDVFVQMPGTFLRIATEDFLDATRASPAMQALFLLYVQAFLVQTASTAMANASQSVECRLARWLLMCHDRADADEVAITHDFLAMMLGCRRPGVTVATHILEGDQMIRAKRGRITVLDRAKLEDFARQGYGAAEAEYEKLIPAGKNTFQTEATPQPLSPACVNGRLRPAPSLEGRASPPSK